MADADRMVDLPSKDADLGHVEPKTIDDPDKLIEDEDNDDEEEN